MTAALPKPSTYSLTPLLNALASTSGPHNSGWAASSTSAIGVLLSQMCGLSVKEVTRVHAASRALAGATFTHHAGSDVLAHSIPPTQPPPLTSLAAKKYLTPSRCSVGP